MNGGVGIDTSRKVGRYQPRTRAEIDLAQGADDVFPGGGLLRWRDGVLEIQTHRIGGARRGLPDHVGSRSGHEQQRSHW